MGSELLTQLPNEGDGASTVPHFSYTDVFDEHFPYYLAIGMTAEQYWHGDPTLCRAYRKADRIRQERMNYEKWLQGAYIYDAICQASPLLNAFSKRGKPFPYAKKPYEFDKPVEKKSRVEVEKEQAEIQKNKFMNQMRMINAKFARMEKEEGEKRGGQCN